MQFDFKPDIPPYTRFEPSLAATKNKLDLNFIFSNEPLDMLPRLYILYVSTIKSSVSLYNFRHIFCAAIFYRGAIQKSAIVSLTVIASSELLFNRIEPNNYLLYSIQSQL